MRAIFCASFVIGFAAASAASATPSVEVVFAHPSTYADVLPGNTAADEPGRQAVLAQIRDHLLALGTRHLKSQDRLVIEVADIDLAGERRLLGSERREIRLLRDATPPRIRLRYVLTRGGVQTAGEDVVTALDYLHDAGRCRAGGTLCREKALLSEWFAQVFGR